MSTPKSRFCTILVRQTGYSLYGIRNIQRRCQNTRTRSMGKKKGAAGQESEDLDAILAELDAAQTVICTEEVASLAPTCTQKLPHACLLRRRASLPRPCQNAKGPLPALSLGRNLVRL